jgi:TonB family protein
MFSTRHDPNSKLHETFFSILVGSLRVCRLLPFLIIASVAAANVREYRHDEWKAVITPVRLSYPVEARRAKMQGEGRFRLCFAPGGRITAVKVLKSTGHQTLDGSVTRELRQWRAKPGPRRELDMSVGFMITPGWSTAAPPKQEPTILREFTN